DRRGCGGVGPDRAGGADGPRRLSPHGYRRMPMGSPRTVRDTRRDDRRAARRAQLLEDAVEAIRERGPGATMEQLARRGGVTKPILYRHFRDRYGLIA